MNITGVHYEDSQDSLVTNNVIRGAAYGIMLWSVALDRHTSGYGLNGLIVSNNIIELTQTKYGSIETHGIALEANANLPVKNVAIKDMRGPARSAEASELRWRMQLGLSILWTAYAAATLAWGFLRRSVALRYAALCLFGLTIVKVFFVDMASVKTAYRMLSLLVLGVVLLLVGLLYQKSSRRPAAPGGPPSSS